MDLGLDDFLKNLKDKATTNPPMQSQASKRKQKRIQNLSVYQSHLPALSQDSTSKGSDSFSFAQEVQPMKQASNFGEKPSMPIELPDFSGMKKKVEKNQNKMGEIKLFQDKAFVFITFGIIFTRKQVDILSENIRKHGGKTFEVSFFDWKPLSIIDLFVITSKQISWDGLLQVVAAEFHPRIEQFIFLDHEWITKCLQDNKIMAIEPYVIRWNKVKQEKEVPFVPKRDIYATFHQLRGGTSNQNRRLKRNQADTDALDQYLEEEKLEFESLQVESKLLKGHFKKKRDLKELVGTCQHLFDYSFQNEASSFLKEEFVEKKLHSPITEIISSDDDLKYEETFDLDSNSQSLTFLDQSHPNIFGKEEKDIVILDDSDENSFNSLFSKYKNSDVQFINPQKDEYTEDSFLRGLEVKGDAEKVKEYKIYNPMNKPRAKFWDTKKDLFVCQTGTKQNHNPLITQELEKLQKVYTNEKDFGRMCAYRKAVAVVRALPFKIESQDDLKNVRELGQKIKEKIVEIVTTGRLKKADILTNDIKQKTIEVLTKVWGIGVQTAIEFFHKGFRTIDDLRKNQHLLNDNQKVGLKYFDDLQKRMAREEVAEILKVVQDKIEEMADEKKIFEVICCGSYRRGKPTCGDIDILVTRKDGKPIHNFLSTLVKNLEGMLLTDHLTMPRLSSHGNETYMGICRHNGGLYRRIDIKVYPREQFGYALVHFTGNDFFNRSMRLFARKKGLTLSDHGLHPSIRQKQDKLWTGQNIPCYTEEEVFNALGIQYRPPTEREV